MNTLDNLTDDEKIKRIISSLRDFDLGDIKIVRAVKDLTKCPWLLLFFVLALLIIWHNTDNTGCSGGWVKNLGRS
ncbi:MAG: hypothetical protein NVS9B7_22130 [Flavisolibacter sp.]